MKNSWVTNSTIEKLDEYLQKLYDHLSENNTPLYKSLSNTELSTISEVIKSDDVNKKRAMVTALEMTSSTFNELQEEKSKEKNHEEHNKKMEEILRNS